uniref:FecR family protein n=1 Tax=Prevotella sp. GTC17260 TaxID=3236796 RepID=A0AB33JCM5_9BACT
MENQNTDRELIRSFFYHQFSRTLRLKFGWWLLNGTSQQVRDVEMENLWNETDGTTSPELEEDRKNFHYAIVGQQRKEHIHRYMFPAAAATILIMASSIITYFMSAAYFRQQSQATEFVRLTVPETEMKTVVLSDSTHVIVNAGSTLIYPKKFNTKTRTVFLMGEANFDVQKNIEKPFTVLTQYMAVTALGTRFDVTAYSQLQKRTVTLEKGKVSVSIMDKNRRKQTHVLSPNQTLSYIMDTHEVSIHNVDAGMKLSWDKGYLMFDGARFRDIIGCLERRYGVRITCTDMKKMNGLYYVKFKPDENLRRVLDILSTLSTPFRYRVSGNDVTIMP